MKKLLALFTILCLAILTACGGSEGTSSAPSESSGGGESSSETITLRLGHVTQTTHPFHLAAEKYAELVKEKTNGQIEIEIFPARQLGGDVDMLEMIQNGSLDAGFITTSVFSGSTPVLDGLQLPFLINNYDVFDEVLKTDTIQKMLDSLEEINVKGLAINESGMRHIGSNRSEVQTPADLEGLKIRVVESPLMLDIFNALGASPTPMAYGEIYSSLQTGVIDAHEANLPAYVDEKFAEVTEYITLTGHFPFPNANIMNLDKFNSLTPEQQTALDEAAKEASAWIITELKVVDESNLTKLKDAGQNIAEVQDITPFLEKVQPVYDKYSEKHELIKELIDKVNEIKAN
ncbi:TRAP transporter substrate-binding protein [Bacillus sp. Marseille-P3661]|uniref:TRAP transporter substrate-binding protein n=1 Tax=Bacillus sp. Marseille-P3661 TaxID=1936234 RepID=UPI000C827045|nr:TRAP transporter substrate-binding protein [Bacillus sp. Marseille-P3661]